MSGAYNNCLLCIIMYCDMMQLKCVICHDIHGKFWIASIHQYSRLLGLVMTMFNHSTDSSNELPDLHTTHTFAGEEHASVVTECHQKVGCTLHWSLSGHRHLEKTSNWRRFQLNQYLSHKGHSGFKTTWNLSNIVCFVLQIIFLT